MTDKRILIGEIGPAHGVKGLVKMRVYAENLDLFNGPLFTGEVGDETLRITLKNAMKDHWLIEIKDIHDRTAAEKLRGTKLYVTRDALPETGEGEYYHADLIGLECVDESGNKIGTVTDIQNFGAGDLLDIQTPDGQNFYLPFTKDTVPAIAGVLTIRIPEGLLD